MNLFNHFFLVLRRNATGVIIYAVIMVVMVLSLVVTFSKETGGGDVPTLESYSISYVDNSNSDLSRGIINYLGKENEMTDFSGRTKTEIENIVFFATTYFNMTIPADLEDGGKITYSTAAGSTSVITYEVSSKINDFISLYRSYIKMGFDEKEAVERTENSLSDNVQMRVVKSSESESVSSDEKRNLVVFNMNQYFCYLVTGFMCLGIGQVIIINNKKNLEDRINISPVPEYMNRLVNTVCLYMSGLIVCALYLLFDCIYGRGTEIMDKYFWVVALNLFLSTLTACSLTSLLTNLIHSSSTQSMVTNIVTLSMSFFCGVFVPQRFIGESVLRFARFLPYYWTVYVNNMTSSTSGMDFDLRNVLIGLGIQLLFAIAIAGCSILFKPKKNLF